jgi:septal ring factor EnvC (AmiA/AmiB activator)
MPQLPPILPFAVLSCVALAAAVLSAVALFAARMQDDAARKRAAAGWARREATWEAALQNISQRVESLATELRDFEEQTPKTRGALSVAAKSRTALNLTKRAQALRMHRRGDPPDQIAALLELPLQEVVLLLKVQSIVLSNV